jgi:hypothetical protein
MKLLHELLKEYVAKSSYTVYSLAYASKVNRTTLQRALTGERPISRENLNKLLPFLNLTLNERNALETAFVISQMGEYTYQKHIYIKDLLENLDFNEDMDEEALLHYTSAPSLKPHIIKGSFKIIKYLYQLTAFNVQNSEVPFLRIIAHFHNQFFKDFYEQLQASSFYNLKIQHIVPFAKTSNTESETSLFNLKILSTLLPFALSCRLDCTFTYYYEESSFFSLSGIPLTHYVLSNNLVLLLSTDCENALILPTNFLSFYTQHFLQILNMSLPLLDTLDTPTLLSTFTASTSEAVYSYAIEAQPCLIHCADSVMIHNVMNKNLPQEQKRVLSDILTAQIKNLHALTKAISAFTPEGYQDFVEHGIVYQIPDILGRRLTVEERITVLERLIQLNLHGNHSFYMIKSAYFHPKIEFFAYDNSSVIFYYMQNENEFRTCILTEPNIVESLNHFVSHLADHELIYTIEETNEIFQQSIETLQLSLSSPKKGPSQ